MASSLTRSQRVALKTWNPRQLQALWDAYLKRSPGAKLPSTGMAPNVGGFSPFASPERPPPGTYDPSIDAQVRATGRGFADLEQDTGIANARGQDDFLLGTGQAKRSLQEHLADLLGVEKRGREDYGRATETLGRNYAQLGERQLEGAAGAGMLRGGALQEALRVRTENQGREQGVLDQSLQRMVADNMTQRDRVQHGYEDTVGALGLGLSRGNEDRANTLARAGREKDQFGLDASAQRWFQATQAGYDPPVRPPGQRGSEANPYKVVNTSRGKRRLYHTGYLVRR